MRKGYVFSLLLVTLLGFFMLTMQYYLLERPERGVDEDFMAAREMVAKHLAEEIAGEFSVERGSAIVVTERAPAQLAGRMEKWGEFLEQFENITLHNASIEATNSSLASGLWLAGEGVDYLMDGTSFSLNHSGTYLLVNSSMQGSVNYSSCPLNNSGSVGTRIILGAFDTGAKYTTPGTAYSCFVNFTEGGEVQVNVSAGGSLSIDYSSAPANYTHRVGFDGPDKLYVVFGKHNATLGTDPGWDENLPGMKRYGTANGINFVVSDTGNDSAYDYAFADVDGDEAFTGEEDRLYLREGVVALGGKVFYIRFDLAGNWLVLYNALGVNSLSSWRGVVL